MHLAEKHFLGQGLYNLSGAVLHKAEAKFIQGTAAFATTEASEQRSFRNEYIVPFALIAAYGIANQYASKQTNATDDDLDSFV